MLQQLFCFSTQTNFFLDHQNKNCVITIVLNTTRFREYIFLKRNNNSDPTTTNPHNRGPTVQL